MFKTVLNFGHLVFELVSNFVLRISNLHRVEEHLKLIRRHHLTNGIHHKRHICTCIPSRAKKTSVESLS